MNRAACLLMTASLLALPLGCSTAPSTDSERATLASEVDASLTAFKNSDTSLQELLNKSVGYVVFPDVGKAGFIAGGAYGRGQLFENGKRTGYADISQGTIGLQAGAQTYSELIIFMTKQRLDEFKSDRFAFSANASAVAIKSGAAAAADYSSGTVVFTQTKGGLMAEASIGGQKFTYRPL